jgi:putative transcriptional regulator
MRKRSLFAELKAGFDELAAARQGETTLRSTVLEITDPVEVSPAELKQ